MFKSKNTHREPVYTFPQETWSYKKCEKLSNMQKSDYFGNKYPKGLLLNDYKHSVTYNGGIFVDVKEKVRTYKYNENVKWFKSLEYPDPIIPEDFEFFDMVSWGKAIRKKNV